MADIAATAPPQPPVQPLPVDASTLLQLQGRACIACGTTAGPLTAAGHVYTGTPQGGRLGWAVVACPEHLGGAV
ncbi:hypothetical protein [Streptacidiphilus cavernicola]|uniref:HNH endonuclease n=1 Tax=Streptacidiphilus cavernicola TaxID=3342716 RepID=A0ABV6VY59_9ACTN